VGILANLWLDEVDDMHPTQKTVKHQIPLTAYWISAFKKKINAFSQLTWHTRPKSQGLMGVIESWAILRLCGRMCGVKADN
jgi:hypothetical protein